MTFIPSSNQLQRELQSILLHPSAPRPTSTIPQSSLVTTSNREKMILSVLQRFTQVIETILKNHKMSTMLASTGSSQTFYFKHDTADRLLVGNTLHKKYYNNNSSTVLPHIGLNHSMRICDNGRMNLFVNPNIGWFHKLDLPLLLPDHRGGGKLAGVYIDNLNRPIIDPTKRNEISKVIEKLKFHVKYTIPIDEDSDKVKSKYCEGVLQPCGYFILC